MASEGYHESYDLLSPATRELHRAIVSLIEELEAIDWYQQRADATGDPALRDILVHNRDEEVEHAVMALEWIRRRFPKFDEELKTYLFTEPRAVTEVEEHEELEGTAGKLGAEVAAAPAEAEAGVGRKMTVGGLRRV